MQPTVLLYHFNAKKSAKLRMAAMRLGIRTRAVEKWEYLQPLGALTGDCEPFESFYDGADFSGEMLVMAHLSENTFNAFLQASRAAVGVIPLKAVLTETNKGWNSLELYEQLCAEHKAIKNGNPVHN